MTHNPLPLATTDPPTVFVIIFLAVMALALAGLTRFVRAAATSIRLWAANGYQRLQARAGPSARRRVERTSPALARLLFPTASPGAAASVECGRCGVDLPRRARFCPRCGQAVVGPQATPTAPSA